MVGSAIPIRILVYIADQKRKCQTTENDDELGFGENIRLNPEKLVACHVRCMT